MQKENFIIIETTCPHLVLAKKLSHIILKENLAACIHLEKIESLYFWKGEMENDQEILLSIKTMDKKFTKIAAIIKKYHSYEVPQIIASPITQGSEDYLSWIETNLAK